MKKSLISAWVSAGLLFVVWMAPGEYGQHDADRRIQVFLQEEIKDLSEAWAIFKVELADNGKQYQAYNEFRLRYKSLEFLTPMLLEPEAMSGINNSKFWVWRDATAQRLYPEAGSMQRMEYILLNGFNPDADTTFAPALSRVDSLIFLFRSAAEQMEVSLVDYLYAMQLDQYRQYFRSATGYERIDTNQVLLEYQASLAGQAALAYRLSETTMYRKELHGIGKQLQKAQKYLQRTKFSELDRAEFMDKHLRDLWQRLTTIIREVREDNYVPEWAQQYKWEGASPFSDDWLEPDAFHPTDPTTNREALVRLGRMLFFDPLLSKNNMRTCASCHKPQKAFSDGRQTSQGFDMSEELERNGPSLINTVFNQYFGHDNRHPEMSGQILSVIHHPQEFRADMETIVARLKTSEEYRQLFRRAFPTRGVVDSVRVLQAITAYTNALVSFNAPFDRHMRGERAELAPEAIRGYNLFMGKAQCGGCHFPPLFSGMTPPDYKMQEFHSHGVHRGLIWDNETEDADYGMGKEMGAAYHYFFKTPSLRNLSFTAPYMHNGIFNHLDSTLHFLFTPNEKADNRADYPPGIIPLSEKEQASIQAFLMSLNDSTILKKHTEEFELPKTDGSLVPVKRKAAGIY